MLPLSSGTVLEPRTVDIRQWTVDSEQWTVNSKQTDKETSFQQITETRFEADDTYIFFPSISSPYRDLSHTTSFPCSASTAVAVVVVAAVVAAVVVALALALVVIMYSQPGDLAW